MDKEVMKQIKDALDVLEAGTAVKVKLPKSTILLTVDEICPHIPLKTLKQITTSDEELAQMLRMTGGNAVFNENVAKAFFATHRWGSANNYGGSVTVDVLKRIMPSGVVSDRAHHVSVWDPIMRAFEKNVGKTTMVENKIVTIVSGESENLTCVDLENRQFACTCPNFNSDKDDKRKRYTLCKHLLRTIYHHYEAIFSELEPTTNLNPWTRSLTEIEQYGNEEGKRVLMANWVYYFVRHVFTKLELSSSRFEDVETAKKAVEVLTVGKKQ